MAYSDTSVPIVKGFYASFNGVRIPAIVSYSRIGSGGNAPDIDITTIDSQAREFAQGLVDGGQCDLTLFLDPTSPIYNTLLTFNESGQSAEFRVVVGGVPSGENITDGSPTVLSSNVTGAWSVKSSKAVFTVSSANKGQIPGSNAGHYLQYGTGPTSTAVSGYTDITGGAVDIQTELSVAPTGTSVSIVRPAIDFRRQGRIMDFGHDANIDSPLGMSVTIRYTGAGTTTSGSPSITI